MAEALLHWRAGHSPRSRIRLSIHSQMPRFNVALYAVGSTVPSILKDVWGESAREDAELAAGRRLATNCAAASRPHWRWRKRATGAPPRAGCPCPGSGQATEVLGELLSRPRCGRCARGAQKAAVVVAEELRDHPPAGAGDRRWCARSPRSFQSMCGPPHTTPLPPHVRGRGRHCRRRACAPPDDGSVARRNALGW